MSTLNGILALWQIVKDLGKSTDLWTFHQTLLGYSNSSYKHIHNPGYCTPSDGTAKSVTSSATAGTFGNYVDVVTAGQINRAFDIHWLSVTDMDTGLYIIELHRLDGAGASEELLCQVPASRTDNFSRVGEVYTQIPVQPADARIGARCLRSTAGAGTVQFVAHYHDYQ